MSTARRVGLAYVVLLHLMACFVECSSAVAYDAALRGSKDKAGTLCGLICVVSAANVLGANCSLIDVAHTPGFVDAANGSSLHQLQKAAESLGFSAMPVEGLTNSIESIDYLAVIHVKQTNGPALKDTDYDHFELLVGRSPQYAWLSDYPKPVYSVPWNELKERMSGKGLLLSSEPITLSRSLLLPWTRRFALCGVIVLLGLLFLRFALGRATLGSNGRAAVWLVTMTAPALVCMTSAATGESQIAHAMAAFQHRGPQSEDTRLPSTVQASTQRPLGERYEGLDWWDMFMDAYCIAPEEAVRYLPHPRAQPLKKFMEHNKYPIEYRDTFIMRWNQHSLVEVSSINSVFGTALSLEDVAMHVAGLQSAEIEVDRSLTAQQIVGDWSVNVQAAPKDLLRTLVEILQLLDPSLTIDTKKVTAKVVVVKGTPSFRSTVSLAEKEGVYIYESPHDTVVERSAFSPTHIKFIAVLSKVLHTRVIDKSNHVGMVRYPALFAMKSSVLRPGETESEAGLVRLSTILDHVHQQTGLEFDIAEARQTILYIRRGDE